MGSGEGHGERTAPRWRKTPMTNVRLFAAVPFVLALVACSAPDPGGPVRPYSSGHSSGSGSGSGASSGSGSGATGGGGGGVGVGGGGSGSGSNDYDAGAVPGSTDYDAGHTPPPSGSDGGGGGGADTGTSTPPTGPLGSCGNPLCGTSLAQCGCRATDSANNTVELGCESGGQCGCFINGQFTAGTASDENGACGLTSSVKARFLSDCTCQ
jgi:hypothetical protein